MKNIYIKNFLLKMRNKYNYYKDLVFELYLRWQIVGFKLDYEYIKIFW